MFTPTRPSAVKKAHKERVRLIIRDGVIVVGCITYMAIFAVLAFAMVGSAV